MYFTKEKIEEILEDPDKWVDNSEFWKEDIIIILCRDWLEMIQKGSLEERALKIKKNLTIREACRRRMALDGTDAQALEHALTQVEEEAAINAEAHSDWQDEHVVVERLEKELFSLRKGKR